MGCYQVVCPSCERKFTGYALSCECFSLLRTVYSNGIKIKQLPGLWRFLDWLPLTKPLQTRTGSVTYRSTEFGKELGLKNLYIAFTGYWPERGAYNLTGSFKDLESNPTIARAIELGISSLVVASAGNTARAFAQVANQVGFDVILIVPKTGLSMMWTPDPPSEHIRLLTVEGDYTSSINAAKAYCELNGFQPEGGAKNVARRDGMGTVMLDSAFAMKRLPDHYFQAIGSGTGAIACWEMALRLRQHDWRGVPILHLAQNAPFVPIVNAWQAGRRQILPEDMPDPDSSIRKMYATVLSNRSPPYAIKGGVYEALSASQGKMYSITNSDAKKAGKLFKSLEGIDLLPAAEVGVAALVHAVETESIGKTDFVLLNVTGGGLKRIKEDFGFHQILPHGTIDELVS